MSDRKPLKPISIPDLTLELFNFYKEIESRTKSLDFLINRADEINQRIIRNTKNLREYVETNFNQILKKEKQLKHQ